MSLGCWTSCQVRCAHLGYALTRCLLDLGPFRPSWRLHSIDDRLNYRPMKDWIKRRLVTVIFSAPFRATIPHNHDARHYSDSTRRLLDT